MLVIWYLETEILILLLFLLDVESLEFYINS